MSSRISAAIRRMLPAVSQPDPVHFHLRHDGRAYVCDRARCESPSLTVDDLAE